MRFDNKAALITGGASGFGRRIAELFAREGARVAIADINEPAAREAAAAISNTAIAMRCDVSQRADVDAAVQATQDAFGGIDIGGYSNEHTGDFGGAEQAFAAGAYWKFGGAGGSAYGFGERECFERVVRY